MSKRATYAVPQNPAAARDPRPWVRVGRWDDTDTRALFVRETFDPASRHLVARSIELCSGRAGGDSYVELTPANFVNGDDWRKFADVVRTAVWALDGDEPAAYYRWPGETGEEP